MTSTAAPRTLDELRAIADPGERARAVAPYIKRAEDAIGEARKVRRDAIAALLDEHGLTTVAREAGVSVSTVKNVRDGRTS